MTPRVSDRGVCNRLASCVTLLDALLSFQLDVWIFKDSKQIPRLYVILLDRGLYWPVLWCTATIPFICFQPLTIGYIQSFKDSWEELLFYGRSIPREYRSRPFALLVQARSYRPPINLQRLMAGLPFSPQLDVSIFQVCLHLFFNVYKAMYFVSFPRRAGHFTQHEPRLRPVLGYAIFLSVYTFAISAYCCWGQDTNLHIECIPRDSTLEWMPFIFQPPQQFLLCYGLRGETWTRNLRFYRPSLYQLSYPQIIWWRWRESNSCANSFSNNFYMFNCPRKILIRSYSRCPSKIWIGKILEKWSYAKAYSSIVIKFAFIGLPVLRLNGLHALYEMCY